MAKHKKHGGGARKPILPSRSSQGRPAIEASAQARARGHELAGLRPDQFEQRLERNLLGAIALRNEPEFADFRFDDEEVVEVTVRHLKRYEVRLNALLKRGDREAARELYDLMRIDVIAELVTPEVRRDLQERSRRCGERLKLGREVDKLEMTLYVDLLLSGQDKVIPLGLCGLFTSIYEDCHRQALEDFEAQQALRGELAELLPLRETSDATQLLALAAQPEIVAQVTQTLEAHPNLRARLERNMDQMIAEVGRAIRSGELPVAFFTDEEILRTYADAYHARDGNLDRRNPPDGRALSETFFDLMKRNLAELITPERNSQFRRYLEEIGRELARSGDRKRQKLGLQLALAAGTLDTWELGKHPFLYEVYIAQAKQMLEQGLATGSSSEREAIFERLVAERQRAGS